MNSGQPDAAIRADAGGTILLLACLLFGVRVDVPSFGVLKEPPLLAGPAPQSDLRHDGELHRRRFGLMETERVFPDPEPTFSASVESETFIYARLFYRRMTR